MSSLFTELKKRKVFRVAAVYAVVAWLLIQVADVVLPALQLPEWTITFVTVLFILGFPIALILAWAYEVTPEGVKADTGATARVSAPAQNQGLLYATFALVLLVAGFQVADRFLGQSNPAVQEATPLASTESARVTRVSVRLPDDQDFHGVRGDFTVSPDGNVFVYRGPDENSGDAMLWVRRLDSLEGRPLVNTTSASRPKISPDGTEVVYMSNRGIRVTDLASGQTRTLVEGEVDTPDWSANGEWVYFNGGEAGISRVAAAGGTSESIVPVNQDRGEFALVFPEPLPEENLLFTAFSTDEAPRIRGRVGETGQLVDLVEGVYPVYSPTGHLFYQARDGGQLYAAPFDAKNLELLGPAVLIDEGLLQTGSALTANIGLSDTGRLIYRKGETSGQLATPVWVSREGAVSDIDDNWKLTVRYGSGKIALSPDDAAIAATMVTRGLNTDVWINQLHGPMTRLTFGDQRIIQPAWSGDGESIYYSTWDLATHSIYVRRADGSGPARRVLTSDYEIRGFQVAADGLWLLYRDTPRGILSGRIRGLELGVDSEPVTLLDFGHESSSPALSPDGRWLAYVSDESGQYEIYVRPFPEVDSGRWQVSVTGGTEPFWAHSGKELFYRNGNDEMVVVDLVGGDAFQWETERVLFDASPFIDASGQLTYYDLSSDDQRFLMLRRDDFLMDTELIMVDNWMADFNR